MGTAALIKMKLGRNVDVSNIHCASKWFLIDPTFEEGAPSKKGVFVHTKMFVT